MSKYSDGDKQGDYEYEDRMDIAVQSIEEEDDEAELRALANSFADETNHKTLLKSSKDLLKNTNSLERQIALDEAAADHETCLFYLTEYLDRCHRLENMLSCISKITRECGDI